MIRSGHRTSNKAVGAKQCKHKYSSYCVQDVDDAESIQALNGDDKKGGDKVPQLFTVEENDQADVNTFGKQKTAVSSESDVGPGEADGSVKRTSPEGDEGHKAESNNSQLVLRATTTDVSSEAAADPQTYDTIFVRDHENIHHGHSHAHSHLHSKPDSISSVGKYE